MQRFGWTMDGSADSDSKYDVCSYTLRFPTDLFTNETRLIVRFTQLDSVKAFLSTDDDAQLHTEYSIGNQQDMVLSFIPDSAQSLANFQFQFWIEGEEISKLKIFLTSLLDPKNTPAFIFAGVSVLGMITFCICDCMLPYMPWAPTNRVKKTPVKRQLISV